MYFRISSTECEEAISSLRFGVSTP